jgi:cytochrome c-type biogenesis protein
MMVDLGAISLLTLAFSAGAATFFAPCAFPLLPGYLSYFLSDSISTVANTARTTDSGVVERRRRPLGRAALVSVAACLGMTLVYVGLAGTTIALGAQALTDIAVLELVVGSVFIVAGGTMAAGWTVDRSLIHLPERRRSIGGFFAFGALYAGAAAGCTAPLFIAIVVRGIAAGPALGVGLAVSYAFGMSAVLIVLTVLSALGGSSIASTVSQYTRKIYRLAGILLVLSGGAEIYYFFYGFPEVVLR